jgi:hypothetical protein
MKTAPRIEEELGEALHAYADRIPAVPDTARLFAALDAAPLALATAGPRVAHRMVGTAAGIALLLGAGGLAWAMAGSDGDEDPVVKVTAVDPATTVAPSTAPATTIAATTVPPTTVAPATLAPATLAPTTVPPTAVAPTSPPPAPPVQAAPPVVTPAAQHPAAAALPRRQQPSQHAPATTAAAPHVDPPAQPTAQPPTPPAAVVGFTASAAYGSCSEDPPYDLYSGTAGPGTTVTISSAFGGGSTQADEHGHWEEKVVFGGAPLNETFSVTVSSAQGSAAFDFTHTG